METQKKTCSCDKIKELKRQNNELKKQVTELLVKIEQLEKFIKGETI